jgi:hypothetical protein
MKRKVPVVSMASNRLFLILVDRRNYFDSWKLKRAKQLLITRIGEQLADRRQLGARSTLRSMENTTALFRISCWSRMLLID